MEVTSSKFRGLTTANLQLASRADLWSRGNHRKPPFRFRASKSRGSNGIGVLFEDKGVSWSLGIESHRIYHQIPVSISTHYLAIDDGAAWRCFSTRLVAGARKWRMISFCRFGKDVVRNR